MRGEGAGGAYTYIVLKWKDEEENNQVDEAQNTAGVPFVPGIFFFCHHESLHRFQWAFGGSTTCGGASQLLRVPTLTRTSGPKLGPPTPTSINLPILEAYHNFPPQLGQLTIPVHQSYSVFAR